MRPELNRRHFLAEPWGRGHNCPTSVRVSSERSTAGEAK